MMKADMLPPSRHKFRRHPKGADWCTASFILRPTVEGIGLSISAEMRYCGQPRSMHARGRTFLVDAITGKEIKR